MSQDPAPCGHDKKDPVPHCAVLESVLSCRAVGFYGRIFKAQCNVTQSGPLSQAIFNLVVDKIVREWE